MWVSIRHLHLQCKLLPQSAAILLLWFHGVEVWQLDHIRPHSGAGAPADPAMGAVERIAQGEPGHAGSKPRVGAYLMSSSWASSWLAWKMGFLVKSSPRMQLKERQSGH